MLETGLEWNIRRISKLKMAQSGHSKLCFDIVAVVPQNEMFRSDLHRHCGLASLTEWTVIM